MATETAELQPAWNHPNPALSVRLLFAEPCWIAADPAGTGEGWRKAMAQYQIYLDQIASVKEWGVTIYGHLRSRNMPKTRDSTEHWPDAATELFAFVDKPRLAGYRDGSVRPRRADSTAIRQAGPRPDPQGHPGAD